MSKLDNKTTKNQPPPLNAIRVFVEAARLANFSRAAGVLGMTQGGVSRHVATLERFLGQALFLRTGKAVELTDAGRLYFEAVQEPVSSIEMVTRQMAQRPSQTRRLVVRTSLPTFAMTTLIPALPQFRPDPPMSVDLVTSLSPPSPGDVYDVLISRDLALGNTEQWLLSTENWVCVASPAVVTAFAVQPIANWSFLAAQSRPDVLSTWAQQQGLQPSQIHVQASFDHYFLAIPAAISGMGHLVAPEVLVAEPLGQGLLVRALPDAVRGDASYCAYINPRSAVPDAGRVFCRWLKAWLREQNNVLI